MKVKEIRLTGGLSQSPAWCQTIADIFGADTVPVEGEGAALGAAIHASWVWMNENGKSTSIEEAVDRFVRINNGLRKKPIQQNVDIYNTQKKLFNALSRRIRGLEGENPFTLRTKII